MKGAAMLDINKVKCVNLTEDHLERVLSWRTQEDVTSNLFTDIDADIGKQRAWFKSIKDGKECHYWLILYDGTPIGSIFLHDIHPIHRRAGYGLYIGPPAYRGQGLGKQIIPAFYSFIFKRSGLGIHKFFMEALADNLKILGMHILHGCRIIGISKDHIFKRGEFRDVMLLEMDADLWAKQGRWQGINVEFEPWVIKE